jgi:hypothetical protein
MPLILFRGIFMISHRVILNITPCLDSNMISQGVISCDALQLKFQGEEVILITASPESEKILQHQENIILSKFGMSLTVNKEALKLPELSADLLLDEINKTYWQVDQKDQLGFLDTEGQDV